MAELYGPFTILDELIQLMIEGKPLPLDKLHIAGSRSCSKSFSVEHATLKAMLLVEGFGALGIRNEVAMAEEMYTEYKDMAETDFGNLFHTNSTKRRIEYNKNRMVISGVKSNRNSNGLVKTGKAKFPKARYIWLHAEEAFEIEEAPKRDIRQGLRSNNETHVLEINTCNPASLHNDYISYLDKHFKFNEKELKTKGYQWSGIIDVVNQTPDGPVITKEAFLYVNWRCVEHLISPSVIRDIRSTWSKDPNRAKVIDYGMPGDTEGAIFGNLMKHVTKAYYCRHDSVRFGVDYGWGTSGNRSPTVATCIGISPMTYGFMKYARYDHDNAKEYIDQNIQVDRLLTWMNETRTRLIENNVVSRNDIIEARFDNAHVGIIAMAQNRVRERGWEWLAIVPCDTKNALSKISQIEIMKMIMCNGLLAIDDEHDKLSRTEYSSMVWENEKEEKMDHKLSHVFDADIYAIGAQDMLMVKDRDPTYFLYTKERGKL